MKQLNLLTSILAVLPLLPIKGQKVYELAAPLNPLKIEEGKLDLGGKSPQGGSISVNNFYMSIDGKPTIPVMGEFHYSRYPRAQWEEQILKMKAGGITVIPTYVFWSQHEEYEGKWNWTGDLDLRYFIQLCQKHGMPVIVRIGPFCHGEMRNGAIPEWVFAKPLEIRSNDPMYLALVKKLYHQIGLQLKGLFYQEGGPIIGCQVENEMQHSAAPWGINYPGEPMDFTAASWNAGEAAFGVEGGHKVSTGAEAGNEHMRTLLKLAQEEGINTPIYTATGWGNAAVIGNKAIPVTSAYPYATWETPHKSIFMMFKDLHKQPDYSPVRYTPQDYPNFSAEMGAGIQMGYSIRPIIKAEAVEAMVIRTLGSGSNGIGYYMYQGGSTPHRDGDNAFFSDEAAGVPKISYDFMAPLGEFGQERTSYRALRLVHSFLADWGELLAPMETVLPEDWQRMTPDNHRDLRYAARMKNDKGFIFMVNAQDHDDNRINQEGLKLKLNLKNETLSIPSAGTFTLPKDASIIMPFNLDMDGALLKYATAQPLMKINDMGCTHYFFYVSDGMVPEYCFAQNTVKGKKVYRVIAGIKSTFSLKTAAGKEIKITTLTRQQALNACKINNHLLLTDATVMPTKDGAQLLALGNNTFKYVIFPSNKGLREQTISVKAVEPTYSWNRRSQRRMSVHFNDSIETPQVHEYFLRLDYVGDVAMAFLDGQLCQDQFWHGEPWLIGLKRHKQAMSHQDMNFYVRPLKEHLEFVKRDLGEFTKDLNFSNGSILEIKNVRVIPEYKVHIHF